MIDRRTFLTAASGLALTARMTRASVQGANNRIRIGIIGTGGRARGLMSLLKRLPGNEMVAVCDVYEPRMLQAVEIAGADSDEGGGLQAHPRRPRDRRGGDWHARSLAQEDHARRGSGREGRLRREAGLAHARRRAPRWSRPSRPRSRSSRPGRSNEAGITGCWESRSSIRAGWDRSHSFRPTGISTRRPATIRPCPMDKLDWKTLARAGARPSVPTGALLSMAAFLGFRRRTDHRPDDALDRRRPLVHGRRGAADGRGHRA